MHTLNKSAYALAISLSFLAGFVDAVGFLQLSGYFVSFMSGNSTQLAVGLAAGHFSIVILLLGIITCFVSGVMIGTWVRHFSKPAWAVTTILALVTALLSAAALSNGMGWHFPVIMCMALAMGAENTVFQRNGETVVGLTYMTGTLVKTGQRMAQALLGGAKFAWLRYLLLWLGLITGGAIGALLFYFFHMDSLWIAVLWAACLTLATRRMPHAVV